MGHTGSPGITVETNSARPGLKLAGLAACVIFARGRVLRSAVGMKAASARTVQTSRIAVVHGISVDICVPIRPTPGRIGARKPPRPRIVISLIRVIQPRLRIAEVAGELLDIVRRGRGLFLPGG